MAQKANQAEELAGLVADQRELVQPSSRVPFGKTWRRRLAVVSAATVACSAAFLATRSMTACAPAPSVDEVVQEYAADPMHSKMRTLGQDRKAVMTWLAAASASGEGVEASVGRHRMTRTELAEEADQAIKKALATKDPMMAKELVEKTVKKAMSKAVIRNAKKRKSLLKYLKEVESKKQHGGFLRGDDDKDDADKKNPVVAVIGDVGKALLKPTTKSPSTMEAEAYCTFDVLQIVTTVAVFASSINDVVKTCEDVSVHDLMLSDASQTHAKVCSVNLAALAASMASLATNSALAADDCAATMIPNVDALCSGAITATLTASAAFAGAFSLINAACRSQGWYARVPPGITPSNVGSNEMTKILAQERADDTGFDRRLEDVANEDMAGQPDGESAPARKLLFGGGKGSLATQCGTQVANVAWSIAGLVMDIYNAAGEDGDGNCPPTNLLTGKEQPQGLLYKISVGLCNMDVSSALLNIFSIMIFGQLIAVTCTDELNLGAICGSGIVGVLAGAAGISKAGTALWIACDFGQTPLIRHLVGIIRELDQMSGEALTNLIRGGNLDVSTILGDLSGGSFGRRLHESDTVAELKAKYDSPADVWKDLGFDLEDPNALWRRVHKEKQLRDGDLANFAEKDEYHPIFGQSQTCSAS